MQAIQLDYSFKRPPWSTGLVIDFTVKNTGDVQVRNVRIDCALTSASGTVFESKSLVVEGPIAVHSETAVEDFDTGFKGFTMRPTNRVLCKVLSFDEPA